MGNRGSQDAEFHEGMMEISARGFGSFRLVSRRDIFKKPLLTTSESSSTTTEDLAERCPCKCHEKQGTLENGVKNCCRCNRPKITEPADGCSCQCHKALQEQLKKCCVCRTPVNTTNSSDGNQSENAPSERSADSSCDSRSNLQMIVSWFYQTGAGESPNDSNEAPSNRSPSEDSTRSSSGDHQPEQASPAESTSDSSANRWGLRTLTGWIFQTPSEESQNNPSAANLVEDISEDTSSNSSASQHPAPPEESPEYLSTSTWWDFHMISYWLWETTVAEAQSCSDDNLSQQTPSEDS